MKLSYLNEEPKTPIKGLANQFTTIFKRQQDPNFYGDVSGGASRRAQPKRTGNQNTAIKDPRHREYFNVPKDGTSIEAGTEQPISTDDGLLNPGQTIKTERPVPTGLGKPNHQTPGRRKSRKS